jgi:hypothetical protein
VTELDDYRLGPWANGALRIMSVGLPSFERMRLVAAGRMTLVVQRQLVFYEIKSRLGQSMALEDGGMVAIRLRRARAREQLRTILHRWADAGLIVDSVSLHEDW